jgi:hypothetical protein
MCRRSAGLTRHGVASENHPASPSPGTGGPEARLWSASLRCPASLAVRPGLLSGRSPQCGSPFRISNEAFFASLRPPCRNCARLVPLLAIPSLETRPVVRQALLARQRRAALRSAPPRVAHRFIRFECLAGSPQFDRVPLISIALAPSYICIWSFPLLRPPKLQVRPSSASRSSRNELSRHKARPIDPPHSGFDSFLVIPSLLPRRQTLKRHILRPSRTYLD